jgi:hypothetical protein
VFFLEKAAYGTSVVINIHIYSHCHKLNGYVKIVVGIHKKRLKSIKVSLQISCRQNVRRTQIVFTLCVSLVSTLYCTTLSTQETVYLVTELNNGK